MRSKTGWIAASYFHRSGQVNKNELTLKSFTTSYQRQGTPGLSAAFYSDYCKHFDRVHAYICVLLLDHIILEKPMNLKHPLLAAYSLACICLFSCSKNEDNNLTPPEIIYSTKLLKLYE